ncbi:S-adenosyl-L-methionine-dependent methyltransferase [Auriscalpium vulgare]|uniref:S-adenosyl-L-methionine-dependent methyltransferase n=1 Tax=Auriscalpium vulgare TaxID=40419 RepID=A0ACB8S1P9_9AGAM|nr:S-adenosyl-L-methionine-dependent methyltransferase [Auriscalpium vulgare]
MSSQPAEPIVPVRDRPAIKALRTIIKPDEQNTWDEAWKQNVTPWDAGGSQPPLRALLESKRVPLPTAGKALVPGAGRAWDALLVASTLGLDTVAVDISPTAIAEAQRVVESTPTPKGKVSIEEGDFFALALPESERYDLILDYTFFGAIPPSLRADWGAQMAALAKPGGYLISLLFPLGLSPEEGGPPHYVIPEHLDQVLSSKDWTKLIAEAPENSSYDHVGKDWLTVWRRN